MANSSGITKSFEIELWNDNTPSGTYEADIYGVTPTSTINYAYDPFNQLIRRALDSDADGPNDSTDTFYSHLNGQIALQFDGDAASDLTHRYFWGAAVDQLLADEQVSSLSSAGSILWPLADQVGTIRDLATHNDSTDATTIVNHRVYDAFGNLTSETNSSIDHGNRI
jgi:hypothetical protein